MIYQAQYFKEFSRESPVKVGLIDHHLAPGLSNRGPSLLSPNRHIAISPSPSQLRKNSLPQLDGPTLTTQGTDKRCPFTAKFGRKRNLDGQDAPQRLKATLLQGETAYRRPPASSTTPPRGCGLASSPSASSPPTGPLHQPQPLLPSSRYVVVPGV